jgi:23S rRNA pseudouridine1911/1915/1917 synthase
MRKPLPPEIEKDELYEHYRFVVDPGQASERIDKYLAHKIANVSRNRIQNAAKSDCIIVNGLPIKNNYKIKPKDVISIVLPEPPRDEEILPENIPLNIIYEDEEVLLVNKEAGMVVHPAYGNYTGTLVNALIYHFQQLPQKSGVEYRAGLVHRIDKDTSGLLVIAKNDLAMTFLAKQFFDHSITRKYMALVWGDLKSDKGTIRSALARDPKDRKKMKSFKEEDKGKLAITHYNVLERYGYTSLIECELETGRTHQIRVHLASIGHPLFNDEMYGGADIRVGPTFTKYKQFIKNCFEIVNRQALHAKSLGFIHPQTRKFLHFETELPADMNAVIEKWRNYMEGRNRMS